MRTILGLERISEYDALFRGKAIGLITNFSGITPDWSRDDQTVFRDSGYQVTRIFTPEHGMYGAGAGEAVEEEQQAGDEIPVVSLYGKKKKPAPEDLQGIDILVFDIQDAGLRYYTYLYTMTYAMEAAADAGIPFVVLDRPNPLGGRKITGARILPTIHSFVGDYELPMRYGLTLGEAAGYFRQYRSLKLDLTVITMKNYTADMMYPDTGLKWNIPSPSLPAFENTVCYSGGCLFEACNISEGRGSARPFMMYGAPFLDMDLLYSDLINQKPEEAFAFRRRAFVPVSGKYAKEICYGLEFLPLDQEADFLPMALTFMKIISDRYPDQLIFRKEEEGEDTVHLKVLYGNDLVQKYLQGKISLKRLKESWEEEDRAFADSVRELRLYLQEGTNGIYFGN